MSTRGTFLGLVLGLILLGADAKPALAKDPRLSWYTLSTPHARIHYHAGLEPLARRTGQVITGIQERLVEWLGVWPSEPTEIVLSDGSEDANGFASVLPYASIVLYATAPSEMDNLSHYDEWLPTLLAHEQTHIVHIDTASGVPGAVSSLLGKTWIPNQLLPRWFLEGLAVLAETRLSGGGRLRSALFEMQLRANFLEDRVATLDQISGTVSHYPGAGLWYLYGAHFVEFIERLYGPSVFGSIVTDIGDDIVPFGISRALYRATGRPVEDLYRAFVENRRQHFAHQLAELVQQGLREGKRLSFHGGATANPRFIPKTCGTASSVSYFRDDWRQRPGFVAWSEGEVEPIQRSSQNTLSWFGDCQAVFEALAPSPRQYSFSDLYRIDGRQPNADPVRLTVGRRASDPDVSSDGRFVTYVTNQAGTTTLMLAELDGTQLVNERELVESAPFDQVGSPRFSPNGEKIAYTVFKKGGYRDIRIVSRGTGEVLEITNDRATDRQPSWSPDGRTLYFSSDRSSVPNIYAFEIELGELRQVTRVRTGAFMPEVSPDQKTLFYVGYSSDGFDLYEFELVRSLDAEVSDPPPRSPDAPDFGAPALGSAEPYRALPSLRPRALELDLRHDPAGTRLLLGMSGSDAIDRHRFSSVATFEPEGNQPDLRAGYQYRRLPVGFGMSAFRTSDPDLRYEYGSAASRITETRLGAESRLSIPFPAQYAGEFVELAYRMTRVSSELPTGVRADPYGTVPSDPFRGTLGTLSLGYSYSSLEWYAASVGYERGFFVNANLDVSDPRLGGELEGVSTSVQTGGYLPLWPRAQHVLALRLSLAASQGRAGAIWGLGGLQQTDLLNALLRNQGVSRFGLRGYPSARFRGRRLVLGQVEYRFPLLTVDRGISTLPFFVRRLGLAFSSDWGGAFTEFDPDHPLEPFHLSLSAELFWDMILGYRRSMRWALGYSRGTDPEALPGGAGYLVMTSAL